MLRNLAAKMIALIFNPTQGFNFHIQSPPRSRSTLLIDDTPGNYAESYGNGICMPPYSAGSRDAWLLALRFYLRSFAAYTDVRVREKRSWHVGWVQI